jgi:hypothetical protein
MATPAGLPPPLILLDIFCTARSKAGSDFKRLFALLHSMNATVLRRDRVVHYESPYN